MQPQDEIREKSVQATANRGTQKQYAGRSIPDRAIVGKSAGLNACDLPAVH
jgi:hypothetical protein